MKLKIKNLREIILSSTILGIITPPSVTYAETYTETKEINYIISREKASMAKLVTSVIF